MHCESQCQGSSKCGLSQGRTSSHGSRTFQGDIFPVHEETASPCPHSLKDLGPFAQAGVRQSQPHTSRVTPVRAGPTNSPVGSAWNTGRAGAEVPEAKSPVDGGSPSPVACSMGSLPGAGHTRDTNLARAARPAAPQARCLWGSLELGCSLGHPGWGHPAAPGALHRGKRQSRVILWGQSLLSLQCWLPVVGLPCQHSWGHTNARDQQPLEVPAAGSEGEEPALFADSPGIHVNSCGFTLCSPPCSPRGVWGVPEPLWQQAEGSAVVSDSDSPVPWQFQWPSAHPR